MKKSLRILSLLLALVFLLSLASMAAFAASLEMGEWVSVEEQMNTASIVGSSRILW